MTERSSFFSSVNGDRKYKASDFAEFFNSFLTNGVFPNPSTNLQILSNNNMTVTVMVGKAWINGYFYFNTDNLVLSLDTADGVLNRIDRVVLQYSITDRTIRAKIKKGVIASSPKAINLQRDSNVYEIGLADIYVAAGATVISQANITDLRPNEAYCGWVDSLIEVDPSTLFAQLEDGFSTWFNNIKGQLTTDAAGNLQNQIDEIPMAFIGTVAYFARNTPPTGWLKANGAAISRTTYANLFASIGITFGSGDGSTTFNLPDLRGQFLRGWDDGAGVDTGRIFGSNQLDDIKPHQHSIHTQYNGTGYTATAGTVLSTISAVAGGVPPDYNTNVAGGSETRPKNIALLACIKY